MLPRIAVGAIEHETCGFAIRNNAPSELTLADFTRVYREGTEFDTLGDANTIVDGFVRGVRQAKMELVPLLWANAITGPPIRRADFEVVVERLLDRLRAALPVDGVLLSLHGSFAAQDFDDADGEILRRVRSVVGSDTPLIAVHDLHCNLTQLMAEAADALVVERTYPHVDMAERAVHAAELMAATVRAKVHPRMAFRSLPILWSAACMIDAEPPMSDLVAKLREIDARPRVVSASVGVGYQWIDNPTVGASVVVVVDGDHELAESYAEELGQWIWQRRQWWCREPLSPSAAISQGESLGKFPIILAEQGDNTGGGASGDATEILRLFMQSRLTPSAVLYMVDPDVALQAVEAGVGNMVQVHLGGKSQPMVGPPVEMLARVRAISHGRFVYEGPMWAGVVGELGPTAWLEQDGVHVVVVSERHQPMDLALCRSLGLDCSQLRYICVKSTGHFRSGFGPIAGSIFNVDTASSLSHDFRRLPYSRLGRKMFPLHDNEVW